MKALSLRQAQTCEGAVSPKSACQCRCKGAGHGAMRGDVRTFDATDPHAVVDTGKCTRCNGIGKIRYGLSYEFEINCLKCKGTGKV